MTPPGQVYFDDDGAPVPAAWPDEFDANAHAKLVLQVALDFVLESKSPERLWETTTILGFLLKADGAPRTMRQLGARLNCSHTTAKNKLHRFTEQFRKTLGE